MTVAASAQERNGRALRGALPADGGDASGFDSANPADAIDGDDLLDIDASIAGVRSSRPKTPKTPDLSAAAGRVTPVRPVAPLTTGSIGTADDTIEAFGGETERDAPRGVRVGTFLLYPELILRGGGTTNVEGASGGDAGSFYRVAPSLKITTDWDRHYSETTLRGTYLGYPESPGDADISFEAASTTRIDASELTTIEGTATYSLEPESTSSPESSGSSDTTYKHNAGGSLALKRDVGLISATLRGALDGSFYTGGGQNGSRDNLVSSATVRVAYGLRSTVSPFAEATVLGRFYEGATGRNAYGYAVRSGIAVDAGPKLKGELGVGWRSEDLDGKAYKNLQGILVDGDLTWSPTRLTTVRLSASTAFEASSLTGASGSIVYGSELSVAHSLTRDFAVEVAGGAAYRTYTGVHLTELSVTGSATATYAITDMAALQAQYSYERVDSSLSGQDYDSHAIEAGIRLRR